MAKQIKDVLSKKEIQEVVLSAKSFLSKIQDAPGWRMNLNKGISEYAKYHSSNESTAFKATIYSHTFWPLFDEAIVIPLSTESLIDEISKCDISRKDFSIKTIKDSYILK